MPFMSAINGSRTPPTESEAAPDPFAGIPSAPTFDSSILSQRSIAPVEEGAASAFEWEAEDGTPTPVMTSLSGAPSLGLGSDTPIGIGFWPLDPATGSAAGTAIVVLDTLKGVEDDERLNQDLSRDLVDLSQATNSAYANYEAGVHGLFRLINSHFNRADQGDTEGDQEILDNLPEDHQTTYARIRARLDSDPDRLAEHRARWEKAEWREALSTVGHDQGWTLTGTDFKFAVLRAEDTKRYLRESGQLAQSALLDCPDDTLFSLIHEWEGGALST